MFERPALRVYGDYRRILSRGPAFAYLHPHPALRECLSNYTITFPGDVGLAPGYTVIPHGCATLVLAREAGGLDCRLFGPSSRPSVVGRRAGEASLLLILEFQPAGLYRLTGLPQDALADQILPLSAVDPALCRCLCEALEAAPGVEGLVDLLDRLLLDRLREPPRPEYRQAQQLIVESGGSAGMQGIALDTHCSERHLRRAFSRYLGLGAKTFSRLVRVNRAARLLRRPGITVSCAGDLAGYCDIAHFVRDFQAVCGVSPLRFRTSLADFYSEIAKY